MAWLLATHPTATLTVSQVDRFGRRPVLFVGISMMLGALLLLAAAFQFATPVAGAASPSAVHLPGAWPPLVVFALVVYVCGYQVAPPPPPRPELRSPVARLLRVVCPLPHPTPLLTVLRPLPPFGRSASARSRG